jgi:phosphoglycolate phosphatase-like HAD superfamily hydrolase
LPYGLISRTTGSELYLVHKNISAADNESVFRWKDLEAYLFDIDGTLLLSPDRTHRYAIHRAMLDVFGVETTIDGIAYHGKTDPGIMRAALQRLGIPDATIELKMREALEVVRRDASEKADRFKPNVLPGIRQVLELLRGNGKLLGVTSGYLEVVGWLKIKAAGLRDYFAFGCFSDDCQLREEIFDKGMQAVRSRLGAKASVCFVGDTPDDVRAAQKVGGRIIAVGTGIFKREDLLSHGPDATVATCSELLAL